MNDKEKIENIHKMAQIALGKQITLSCTEYAIKEGFFDNFIALYNAGYRKLTDFTKIFMNEKELEPIENINPDDCKKLKPKLPENSVVLSREEYYELKQAKTLLEISKEEINNLADANIRYSIALENKGKETAEKIYKEINHLIVKDRTTPIWIKEKLIELAKQYEVDIGEEV